MHILTYVDVPASFYGVWMPVAPNRTRATNEIMIFDKLLAQTPANPKTSEDNMT